ncbi:hypothetical protein PR048_026460 [Dryococelus australis]|uniref:Uncharacterized protein n=1 Tax=Dryococelus australis TaxID=614101 RepID=A0ABQ9GLG4_9NEOP|nr:hypothetical protein PR048_026460 [Dryococelus australis]
MPCPRCSKQEPPLLTRNHARLHHATPISNNTEWRAPSFLLVTADLDEPFQRPALPTAVTTIYNCLRLNARWEKPSDLKCRVCGSLQVLGYLATSLPITRAVLTAEIVWWKKMANAHYTARCQLRTRRSVPRDSDRNHEPGKHARICIPPRVNCPPRFHFADAARCTEVGLRCKSTLTLKRHRVCDRYFPRGRADSRSETVRGIGTQQELSPCHEGRVALDLIRSVFNPRPDHCVFSHVGIVPDDAVGRRVFSEIPRFSRPFIPVLLHTLLNTLIGSQDLDSNPRRPRARYAGVATSGNLQREVLQLDNYSATQYVFCLTGPCVNSEGRTDGRQEFPVFTAGCEASNQLRASLVLCAVCSPRRLTCTTRVIDSRNDCICSPTNHCRQIFKAVFTIERRAAANQSLDASVECREDARATNIGFDARRQRWGIRRITFLYFIINWREVEIEN